MSLTTTSNLELKALAKKMRIKNFKVCAIDQLPSRTTKGAYIVNCDVSYRAGTHWVSCYVDGDQRVYYDPFGMPPDTRMLKFLGSPKKRVLALTTQSQDTNASSCGYWCLFFLNTLSQGGTPGYFLSMQDCCNQEKNEKFLERYFKEYI